MIEAGVGVSTAKDASSAGKEAAEKALRHLGKPPSLMMVFASPIYPQQQLLDTITSITKNTPFIGGTTAGEISTWGVSDDSVVILALYMQSVSFSHAIEQHLRRNEFKAGKQLALSLVKRLKEKKPSTLFLFPGGKAGNLSELIKGIQSVLGETFPIFGGALGDRGDFKKTHQYHNGKVYEDSVVGILLAGNIITASGIKSGWKTIGNKLKVTKSIVNSLFELDGDPALDIYQKMLGEELSARLPTSGSEYPIGLTDRQIQLGDGEFFTPFRAPVEIHPDKKSIIFGSPIHEKTSVTIATASRNDVIESAARAAEQALHNFGKAKPACALFFSSFGCKAVLEGRSQEEITAVQNIIGRDVPLAGFFTYGEIAPLDLKSKEVKLQSSHFHNQTNVVFILGSKA
ncbi:hypothetical protein FJZ18_03575 [Candidatus Pacearchaeota archaeon]|nr:hypothetical protein [Candidatus Pacearchaeota archaeon]